MFVRWLLLVVLSAAAVASCGGSGDTEPAKTPAPQPAADTAHGRELQQLLESQRESYGATGTAAAIVIAGRPYWSGGSGLANRETKAPVTADTPFPIFSVTKMFVGGLAVKLAQEGRLKLDDPLSRALPDWPNADRITLRMLLNQTSATWRSSRAGRRAGRGIRGRVVECQGARTAFAPDDVEFTLEGFPCLVFTREATALDAS